MFSLNTLEEVRQIRIAFGPYLDDNSVKGGGAEGFIIRTEIRIIALTFHISREAFIQVRKIQFDCEYEEKLRFGFIGVQSRFYTLPFQLCVGYELPRWGLSIFFKKNNPKCWTDMETYWQEHV